jgi:hypothetical protein
MRTARKLLEPAFELVDLAALLAVLAPPVVQVPTEVADSRVVLVDARPVRRDLREPWSRRQWLSVPSENAPGRADFGRGRSPAPRIQPQRGAAAR